MDNYSLLRLLLMLCAVRVCTSSGTFMFLMTNYTTNYEETGSDGDLMFTFCFDRPHGNPSISGCAYHTTGQSNYYDNTKSIRFGSDIRGIANPITFDMDTFVDPQIMVVIRVMDHNDFFSNDHVTTSSFTVSFRPFRKRAEAAYVAGLYRQGGSTWNEYGYKYKAYCHENFYGDACAVKCQATDSPQTGHYSCNNEGAKVCLTGWQGGSCLDDVDECRDTPTICSDTGGGSHSHWTCANTPGSYLCDCAKGWTGRNCDSDVNECEVTTTSLCSNGGSCVNTNGSYRCDCPSNWNGTDCTDDVDECSTMTLPCTSPNARCNNTVGGYACPCNDGWEGANCTVDTDECQHDDVMCYNNGTCVNHPGAYHCQCSAGWTGVDCSTDVDECADNPCNRTLGIARCLNLPGSFTCRCVNATNNASEECECQEGWAGEECNTDVDECQNDPCNVTIANARCVNLAGSYRCQCGVKGTEACTCRKGWEGSDCLQDVDECRTKPCMDNATCLNSPGAFHCICANGILGCFRQSSTDSFHRDREIQEELIWWPIVLAVVVLIIIIIIIVLIILLKRRKRSKPKEESRPVSLMEVNHFHSSSLMFENDLYNANRRRPNSVTSNLSDPSTRAPMPVPEPDKSDIFVYHELNEQKPEQGPDSVKPPQPQQAGLQTSSYEFDDKAYANGHVGLDVRPHAGRKNLYEDFDGLKNQADDQPPNYPAPAPVPEDQQGYMVPSVVIPSRANQEESELDLSEGEYATIADRPDSQAGYAVPRNDVQGSINRTTASKEEELSRKDEDSIDGPVSVGPALGSEPSYVNSAAPELLTPILGQEDRDESREGSASTKEENPVEDKAYRHYDNPEINGLSLGRETVGSASTEEGNPVEDKAYRHYDNPVINGRETVAPEIDNPGMNGENGPGETAPTTSDNDGNLAVEQKMPRRVSWLEIEPENVHYLDSLADDNENDHHDEEGYQSPAESDEHADDENGHHDENDDRSPAETDEHGGQSQSADGENPDHSGVNDADGENPDHSGVDDADGENPDHSGVDEPSPVEDSGSEPNTDSELESRDSSFNADGQSDDDLHRNEGQPTNNEVKDQNGTAEGDFGEREISAKDSGDDDLVFVDSRQPRKGENAGVEIDTVGETATEPPDHPAANDEWQYPVYELARNASSKSN